MVLGTVKDPNGSRVRKLVAKSDACAVIHDPTLEKKEVNKYIILKRNSAKGNLYSRQIY